MEKKRAELALKLANASANDKKKSFTEDAYPENEKELLEKRKIEEAGKKDEEEYKWKLVDGQIYEETIDGNIIVYRINEDGSITSIAFMNNKGDRSEASKEAQHTYKKIK